MNFGPVRVADGLTSARFAMLLIAAGILSNAAVAQTSQPEAKVTDPLDGLCAKIGPPLRANEIVDFLGKGRFAGNVVSGLSSPYREVIGTFEKDRARSVRYLADGNKTAQFVYVDGRQVCLTAPGVDETTCGVPLACSSGEGDFVMVDSNDMPFVRINLPKKLDPNAQPLPEDHDWVRFAGGSAKLTIPSAPIEGQRPTPAKNALARDRCKIGSGYPALDSAYAYYWGRDRCTIPFAEGDGIVFFLTKNGEIGSVRMGAGSGIETWKGQLRWSFPAKPIEVTVKCSNSGDTIVPRSTNEVKNVEVDFIVADTVEIGDPVVYTELANEASRYIEKICGKAPASFNSTLRIRKDSKTQTVGISLTWNRSGAVPTSADSPALRKVMARNDNSHVVAVRRFARFIRQTIDAQRTSEILSALHSGDKLPSIANGMRENVLRTLVAMSEGIQTWMPWEGQSPNFTDGNFRLSWTNASQDPAKEFFRTRRQRTGWAEIERNLPASAKPSTQLELTCIVPANDASDLAADDWVFVDATMISFSRNSMVLRCRAP